MKFEVRDPDYDSDWKTLNMPGHAGPEDVAESFAEMVHAARDWFTECDLEVRDQYGDITRWTVTVQMMPQFTAQRIEE